MKNMKWMLVIVAAAGLMALPSQAQWQIPADRAAKKEYVAKLLVTVQKADAPLDERFAACRELSALGDKSAVPILAALLPDEKMSHMARYGLEPIPDPSVDAALRDALGKVKGRLLAGVVDSIGVRRDAKAVEPLANLLGDANADVVSAAAASLGRIGNAAAAAALEKALAGASGANLNFIADGCIRAADVQLAQRKRDKATALYDCVRASKAPRHILMAATRGAILARGPAGVAMIMELVKGNDNAMFAVAMRVAHETRGEKLTEALAAEVGKLAPERQIVVLQALGDRKDTCAVPTVLTAAKAGPSPVRVAAIRALPQIGCPSCLASLVTLASDADADVATAAQASLAGFPGKEADGVIANLMSAQDAKTRCTAIDLVGQRRVMSAMPALMKAAEDADKQVSTASFKVLGDMAGAAEIPAMINLLTKTQSVSAENALSAVCARQAEPAAGSIVIKKAVYGALPDGPSADVTKKAAELMKAGTMTLEANNGNFGDPSPKKSKKLCVDYTVNGVAASKTVAEGETVTFTTMTTSPACVGALCGALAQAPVPATRSLLRLLRSAGGPKALAAVRAATNDANAEVKDTATRVLCDWTTAEAAGDQLALAKTSPNRTYKVLALRGYIRAIGDSNLDAAGRQAMCSEATALIQDNTEKRLLFGTLGNVGDATSLAMVMSNIDDPAIKEEACLAAVSIAERLVTSQPAVAAAAMQKVVKATQNPGILKRARKVLGQTRPKQAAK